jgi:CRISPR/Cas system-associated exonuclease Cas4 (RecB family)
MLRGSKIHKQGENYLDGSTKNVPASYKQFAEEMRAIKKLGADAESTFAFTKTWGKTSPTDWAGCWLRIKIDAFVSESETEATIIDFKTGRPYKDTVDQSELYAVGAFQSFPTLDAIDAEFWYLDSGEVVDYHYTRSEFKKLKRTWATRGREMLAARQFPPTTNAYDCKYCPFRSDAKLANGKPGPCNEWKNAK